MIDEHFDSAEQRLDGLWDDLAAGRASRREQLDPGTAEAVRRLHALGAAPPPASSRGRVRRVVMANIAPRHAHRKETQMSVLAPSAVAGPHPRVFSIPNPPQVRPGSRRRPHFATRWWAVAAVMLTFAISLATLATGTLPGNRHERPRTITAAFANATSTSGDTTLLHLVVPDGMIPTAEHYAPIIQHVVVQPGGPIVTTAQMGACCPGVHMDYVLSGTAVFKSDAPSGFSRNPGAGEWETVPAGTDVTVQPGDGYWRQTGFAWQVTNTGVEEAQFIDVILTDNSYPSWPGGWNWRNYRWAYPAPSGPLGQLDVTIRRAQITAGAAFPPPPAGGSQGVLQLESSTSTIQSDDGSATNGGNAEVTVYVLTLIPSIPGTSEESGTPTG